jgi:hypothetical protein
MMIGGTPILGNLDVYCSNPQIDQLAAPSSLAFRERPTRCRKCVLGVPTCPPRHAWLEPKLGPACNEIGHERNKMYQTIPWFQVEGNGFPHEFSHPINCFECVPNPSAIRMLKLSVSCESWSLNI